jgi:hypothetical protein
VQFRQKYRTHAAVLAVTGFRAVFCDRHRGHGGPGRATRRVYALRDDHPPK